MDGRTQWLDQNSLQYRLSIWISVFVAATGLVAGAISFYAALREAYEFQDDQLREVAALVSTKTLAAALAQTSAGGTTDPELKLVVRQLGRKDEPGADAAPLADLPDNLADGMQTISSRGTGWRVFVKTLPSGERIAVAQQTTVRDEIARDSGLRTLAPMLIVIPLLVLLVAFVIRLTLKPITRLAHQMDINNDDSPLSLSTTDVPSEILPFVTSINRLLERLQDSMRRQRRFVADAAHELRSPVTALMLQADNLDNSEMPAEAHKRLTVLRQGLARTRALLEQLLALARTQAVAAEPSESVALEQVVRSEIAGIARLAEAKCVVVESGRMEHINIRASFLDVSTLIRNALDNAVRYTPDGGAVNISLFSDTGGVHFVVENSASGIPERDLQRVFDPFYRVAGSEEAGSGLGLAIVRDIATRFGGRVTLTNVDGQAVRFEYFHPKKIDGPIPAQAR